MHPILILAIAVVLIFLLIIRLRVNAFIALITGALVVGGNSVPSIRLKARALSCTVSFLAGALALLAQGPPNGGPGAPAVLARLE